MKKYYFIAAVFMAISLIAGLPSYGAELKEVQVSNTKELIAAIGDNTRIILAPGVYNLSDWAEQDFNGEMPKNVTMQWKHVIAFIKLNNLQLEAKDPSKETKIVVTDPYIPVLVLKECKNILVKGLAFGHDAEPGECEGCVLKMSDCQDIKLEQTDLYGCGTYGIEFEFGGPMQVVNSKIHDCSLGAFNIVNCSRADFNDCKFIKCGEATVLESGGSKLYFKNCEFIDLTTGERLFTRAEDYRGNCTEYHFDNCDFKPY